VLNPAFARGQELLARQTDWRAERNQAEAQESLDRPHAQQGREPFGRCAASNERQRRQRSGVAGSAARRIDAWQK
jgi:hypothetical protein